MTQSVKSNIYLAVSGGGALMAHAEQITLAIQWLAGLVSIAAGCYAIYCRYKDRRSKK